MWWVSPFRHLRIKGCWHLPVTFRSLPRLSSPLSAKASTRCPFALDLLSFPHPGKNHYLVMMKPDVFHIIILSDVQTKKIDFSIVLIIYFLTYLHCLKIKVLPSYKKIFLSFYVKVTYNLKVVEVNGIEPMTSCLQSTRSPS